MAAGEKCAEHKEAVNLDSHLVIVESTKANSTERLHLTPASLLS